MFSYSDGEDIEKNKKTDWVYSLYVFFFLFDKKFLNTRRILESQKRERGSSLTRRAEDSDVPLPGGSSKSLLCNKFILLMLLLFFFLNISQMSNHKWAIIILQ